MELSRSIVGGFLRGQLLCQLYRGKRRLAV